MPEGGGVPPATGNSYLIWIGFVTLVLLAFSAVNRLILTSPSSKK